MIELYLIRHAECERNLEPHLIGGLSAESPLSALGKQQAQWLHERLQTETSFDHVYVSPAKRTLETAAIVFPDRKPLTSEDLLELRQGSWEGRPRAECYTPEVIKRIKQDNWTFAAPGGESQKDVAYRMLRFVDNKVLPYKGRIAVVGHGMAIKCLLRGMMNFDSHFTYKTVIDNTSITQFSYDGEWMLKRINDAAHVKEYRPAIPLGPE